MAKRSSVPTLLYQVRVCGLPKCKPEHRFHETRKWRFDLAFTDHKLAVEVEGGGFVQGRHTRGLGLEKDAEKYAEAAILGWTVLRVTPRQVKTGQAVKWIERWLRSNTEQFGA